MDEDLDFRRTKFPEVMEAVRCCRLLPTAFLFLAEAQRGKTTFLKRVGWELAKEGYSVVQLLAGSRGEPYARWLVEASESNPNHALVVLIDDPHTDREHFQAQMTTLSDRDARVICLVASRPSDWKQVEVDRVPLLTRAPSFSLAPDRYESEMALNKLIHQGVVQVEPHRRDDLIQEIDRLPFDEGYFHSVIQIASDDRFRPTPVLVEERLQEAQGSAEAIAFETDRSRELRLTDR